MIIQFLSGDVSSGFGNAIGFFRNELPDADSFSRTPSPQDPKSQLFSTVDLLPTVPFKISCDFIL